MTSKFCERVLHGRALQTVLLRKFTAHLETDIQGLGDVELWWIVSDSNYMERHFPFAGVEPVTRLYTPWEPLLALFPYFSPKVPRAFLKLTPWISSQIYCDVTPLEFSIFFASTSLNIHVFSQFLVYPPGIPTTLPPWSFPLISSTEGLHFFQLKKPNEDYETVFPRHY